jgi:hypothetical protein
LVELQQLLQRREVFWPGFAEFERHGRWILRPNIRAKREAIAGRTKWRIPAPWSAAGCWLSA